ncbi:hypothetical protein [Pseudoduganella violaceinigra]|uniref:hypothetical protein n=1 Tax=Pseudoduganella violaceinigra TaxID=246602 RepID=UPI0003F66D79|nr:hypothetical protein [Pseudoduganella violaceinigra]
MNKSVTVFGLLLLAAAALPAQAQSQTKTSVKKVVVETYTTVGVSTFVPPQPVTALTRGAAGYSTPEKAAVALLSAMAAGDYDWWISMWSPEARALMEKRYRDSGRQPADIVANWRGLLSERPAVLLGKAEYARQRVTYALVRYRVHGGNLTTQDTTGKVTQLDTKDFENTLSFKLIDGRWQAVQDLASDPVFHYSGELWDDSKNEIRISRPAE